MFKLLEKALDGGALGCLLFLFILLINAVILAGGVYLIVKVVCLTAPGIPWC